MALLDVLSLRGPAINSYIASAASLQNGSLAATRLNGLKSSLATNSNATLAALGTAYVSPGDSLATIANRAIVSGTTAAQVGLLNGIGAGARLTTGQLIRLPTAKLSGLPSALDGRADSVFDMATGQTLQTPNAEGFGGLTFRNSATGAYLGYIDPFATSVTATMRGDFSVLVSDSGGRQIVVAPNGAITTNDGQSFGANLQLGITSNGTVNVKPSSSNSWQQLYAPATSSPPSQHGSLDETTINRLDGTRTVTAQDTQNTQPWTTVEKNYDNANRLVSEVIWNDDGSVTSLYPDLVNGAIGQVNYYGANGWAVSTMYDTVNTQGWTSVAVTYRPQKYRVQQVSYNDDGSRTTTWYDPQNGFMSRVEYTATTQAVARYTYDDQGKQPWASISTTINPQGQQLQTNIYNDDGSTTVDHYLVGTSLVQAEEYWGPNGWSTIQTNDLAGTQSWSTTKQTLNPAHQITDQVINNRDGSVTEQVFDASNGQVWQTIYMSGGATVLYQYDTKNNQTWSSFKPHESPHFR